MAQRQINVRLDDADAAALEIAALLEGRSLADEARDALLMQVARVRDDPEVMQVLEMRAKKLAAKTVKEGGSVSSLDAKRSRS